MGKEQILKMIKNKEELRKVLAEKSKTTQDINELRGLNAQIDTVNVDIQELRNLVQEIETQEAEDAEEQRKKLSSKAAETRDNYGDTKKEFRTIVKAIMGEELSQEERANITTTDNASVIPKQFVNELQEIKKGFGSLKEYCDVIPVTKNEGTIPVIDLDQNTLPEVAEGDNIIDGTLVTTDIPFKCKKHGLIQSITSEASEDAEVEIESLARKNFTEIVYVCENTKILKVIKDNAVAVVGATGYNDINLAIDEAIPSIKAGLATITNTKGFAHLKNLKDKQDRPLNLVTEMGGKYYFNGKELITVDDTLLPESAEGKRIYYTANMKEAVKFLDRKAVTVARSTEAGFKDDTIKLRLLERFDVCKGSIRSLKKIEF